MGDYETHAIVVYVGTGDQAGISTLVVDRSELPEDYRVFLRSLDRGLMDLWMMVAKFGGAAASLPLLPGGESTKAADADAVKRQVGSGLGEPIGGPVSLFLDGPNGTAMVIHAAPGSRIEEVSGSFSLAKQKPALSVGIVEGALSVFFDWSVPAVELPMPLAPKKFFPIILGIARPGDGQGAEKNSKHREYRELRAGQRMNGGGMTGTYSVLI